MDGELTALSFVKQIKQCHEECLKGFETSAEWGIKCGELLCQMKAAAEHGTFGGMIEQYFEFSHESANAYMRLHKGLGQLSKSQRAKILRSADSIRGVQKLLPGPTNSTRGDGASGGSSKPSPSCTSVTGAESESVPPPPNTTHGHEGGGAFNEDQRGGHVERKPEEFIEPPAKPPPPEKTPHEKKVWEAHQVLKQWADAVGRWMNGNPAGIDVYRELFPGHLGDEVITDAKKLYNSLVAWKKGIK